MSMALVRAVLLFSVFSACSFAQQSKQTVEHGVTQPLEMLAGLAKPPFIIDENGRGMQLDLIRKAFASVNQSVKFTHVPLGRSITEFKRLNVAGVAILPVDYQHPGLFVSKPYISYQNVAVSLADNNLHIASTKDLSGKSVIAFQNAKKFLGQEYHDSVGWTSSYREIANQNQQIEMLFTRVGEVIILDINIFKYFIQQHTYGRYTQLFNVHYIFDERVYAAGFAQEKIRDQFNLGLAKLKQQGSYQQVIDSYLK